jgi:hypothetical protein
VQDAPSRLADYRNRARRQIPAQETRATASLKRETFRDRLFQSTFERLSRRTIHLRHLAFPPTRPRPALSHGGASYEGERRACRAARRRLPCRSLPPGRPASPENSAANESDEANGAPARELLRAQRERRLASPARSGQGSPNKSPARETGLSWSDCLMELAAEGPNHQRQAATPTPSRRVGCTARAGGCQTKAPQRIAGERAGLSQHAGRRKRQRKRSPHRNTTTETVTVAQRRGAPRKTNRALQLR